MFATLAGAAARPTHRSAGYEMSDVIPPAVPTTPAMPPAASRTRVSAGETTPHPMPA